MRLGYPLALFTASSVAMGACLFPSFEGFESASSGASTTSSTVSTGSGGSGGGGGTGGAGAGAGGVDAGACAPVDDALVVWPFDDGTGLIARDCTGKSPGTITGETSWTAGRKGGFALTFDQGDGGQVSPPDGSTVNQVGGTTGPKPFTFATWYKSAAASGYNYPRNLVSRMPGFNQAWSLGIWSAGGGQVKMTLSLCSPGNNQYDQPSAPFDNPGWTHVATTFDGNTAFAFYVNGELNSKGNVPAGSYGPSTANLHIASASDFAHPFEGTLSGVRIYARELSHAEILRLAKR